MNIFWLDYDLKENSRMYCNKHIVKMLVEYAQLMSTACRLSGLNEGYKVSHINNPCTNWVCGSLDNWLLLRDLSKEVNKEYERRYKKKHKSYEVICSLSVPNIERKGVTNPPLCLPHDCIYVDLVYSYQKYYNEYKQHIHQWLDTEKPVWVNFTNKDLYTSYCSKIRNIPLIYKGNKITFSDYITRINTEDKNTVIFSDKNTKIKDVDLKEFIIIRDYINKVYLYNNIPKICHNIARYFSGELNCLLNLFSIDIIDFRSIIYKLTKGIKDDDTIKKLFLKEFNATIIEGNTDIRSILNESFRYKVKINNIEIIMEGNNGI